MTDKVEQDSAEETASETTSEEQLGQLMQADAGDDAGGAAAGSRLESEAIDAAEQAIRDAETAISKLETRPESAEPSSGAEPVSARKLWMLRIVLLINFALMGVMIAIPAPSSPKASEPTSAPKPEEDDPPFVEPVRDPRLTLPKSKQYDAALIAARDGDYEVAAELMHSYIEAHPRLHPSLRQGAYVLLGRYLRLSGRVDEAVAFEVQAQRLVGAAHLPEDLWRTARAAEESGNPQEMRRAYARLLLQRSMLTPSQYAVVTEAYLKFGDSYRSEAESGDEKARAEEASRLDKLRGDQPGENR